MPSHEGLNTLHFWLTCIFTHADLLLKDVIESLSRVEHVQAAINELDPRADLTGMS